MLEVHIKRTRSPASVRRTEDVATCFKCGKVASLEFTLTRPPEDNLEDFSDVESNSFESPIKLEFGPIEASAEDSGYCENEDWRSVMCRMNATMTKIKEVVGSCTEMLISMNPANNLSEDSSENQGLEGPPMENLPAEITQDYMEPEVSELAPLGSGLPCATLEIKMIIIILVEPLSSGKEKGKDLQ